MTYLNHLNRLSKVKSNTGIRFLTPAVYPGNHCPMRFASDIVESVEGLSSLLVGMPECTNYSRIFSPKPEGKRGELHWLYVLDANEVVFGCRKGVIDALRKMDAGGAEAILIVATCVPELIGEDFEGIVHEVQPALAARIAFTLLGQFKNIGNPSGTWKTMEALAALMDAKEKKSARINILGRTVGGKRVPMPPLLTELERRDFSLHHLGPGASLEDFRSAPDAVLNLVIADNTLPLAAKMEKSFGVPYVSLHSLFDVADIDRAYRDIAKRLGFSWDGEFEEERQRALVMQDQAKERFQGLRNVFANRVDTPLALAVYLGRLGMEPLLLHLEEYHPEDSAYSLELAGMGHDPWICRMMNQEAELPILERLSPDMCIGRIQGKGGRRGRGDRTRDKGNSMPSVAPSGGSRIGYDRTADLLGSILDALDGRDAILKRRAA